MISPGPVMSRAACAAPLKTNMSAITMRIDTFLHIIVLLKKELKITCFGHTPKLLFFKNMFF
jgi:hypothetical protein